MNRIQLESASNWEFAALPMPVTPHFNLTKASFCLANTEKMSLFQEFTIKLLHDLTLTEEVYLI